MLLLWSRLAALALVASLATGSPVSPSPLKALDNGLSLEPAPRNEQLTNMSLISTLSRNAAVRVSPIVYPWGSETYRPGDTVTYRWPPTHAPAKADLWLTCRGITGGETSELRQMPPRTAMGIIAFNIPLYKGGTTTTIPIDLPSWLLTDDKGVNVNVSAIFYFGVSRDHYLKDPGVFGNSTHSFIIKIN
ncbi:BZ3500_MvSof-1268-A1-R1_Chr5-1g07607 [Microbotryum saponariae]|uniref:BZ3500_MvSof-1268-A1-R1_Chr5-1g07607 protein n=1 Tax=Microbotryum saponariae TaxID=289078 RepID=A0A2X0LK22_9BASI|nr:BZ3500_MvSof-1268-A1-R1_Chr5-1g07607 [Microbotryum saponariae]SDA05478.1 BZ3501_MvSof-1269-A2-R1_Chr5-2g07431 [Microbotryum saponariae]